MPTRHMVSLVAVLCAVFAAAISQGNGPAYLPAYALLSLTWVSWIHNRSNVLQLEISAPKRIHGFAGAVVLIPYKLRNLRKRPRFGLKLTTSLGGNAALGKLETLNDGQISLSGLNRGIHHIKEIKVTSIFPIGVFKSASTHLVNCVCYVYPEAIGERELPGVSGNINFEKNGERISSDDFAGVRNYQVGESQRHIDWKAVARGQPLMIKQFESRVQKELWLDITQVKSKGLEAQLSQLALWVMLCERAGIRYGLRLGKASVSPAQGDRHLHDCLGILASHGLPGKLLEK